MNSKGLNLVESIATERLVLRRLRYEDAEEIFYGYASKSAATKYVSWPTHERIDDTRDFLYNTRLAWTQGREFSYSIRLKNAHRLIGSFGLINEGGKVQFGYIINPSQWGNGFATEACCRMMALLSPMDEVYRIWTVVDVDNIASIRVLEKSGLKEEVRLSKWMRFVNQGNAPKDCALFRLPL